MLETLIKMQIAWSEKTFGHGRRTEGICKHIEKELQEIRSNPDDLIEWIDVIILALDGAWRCVRFPGGAHRDPVAYIANALQSKMAENWFNRTYPMPTSEDEPSEHVRGK